jgi:hypothetical protein
VTCQEAARASCRSLRLVTIARGSIRSSRNGGRTQCQVGADTSLPRSGATLCQPNPRRPTRTILTTIIILSSILSSSSSHPLTSRPTTTVTSSPITGVDQPVAVPLAVPSGATASGALTVQRPSAAAAPTPSTTGNGTPTLRSRLPTEQAGRVPPRPVIGVVRGATSAVVGTMRPFCGRGHRREHHSHQNVGRSPARRTSRARSQPRRVSLR